MCFNPGDGEGVLEAYVMEKLANALNDRFVAADLDRVVPQKTHTVHTVGEKIDTLRSAGSVFLEVLGEPLQGVVNRADSLVLSVRREAPIQLNSAGSVMTGPHSNALHPAVQEERDADPSV